MAQIAPTTDIDIDWMLAFLTREWRNVPGVVSGWDAWDQEARHDYLNEWPVTESYGEILQDAVDGGKLSADQSRVYQELLVMIRDARPAIEDLLERG